MPKPILDLETLLRTLADRTRLRLLNLMREHEVCVCYFVETLQTSQPKISRHLAYLRRSGLVSARREGLWQHYSIVPPSNAAVAGVLRETLNAMATDKEAERDLQRLERACCNPAKFVKLEPAPIPAKRQP
jgi:ArsR family transcriptional regulator, arsenate/arsenite/antimonite-responsive transcriptional repressor